MTNLFATLKMIVFLMDQIQQLSNKVFKKVLALVKTKIKIWEQFSAVFRFFDLNSFKQLLMILIASYSLSKT